MGTEPIELSEMQNIDTQQPTRLTNRSCPYCGQAITPDGSSNDHVIARRFVPRGALRQSWNLILRACNKCNGTKSELEDDLSAISLQPTAWGEYAEDDEKLRQEASRKAEHSFSRRTGRAVGDSQENITLTVPFGPNVQMTVNLVAPPQPDWERAHRLAMLQLAGFFYWLTYDEAEQLGHWWTGVYMPLELAHHPDWGNPVQRSFIDAVYQWEPRLVATVASGYFRAAIRRCPQAACWSWGLEWNKNIRIIGFFGDYDTAQATCNRFTGVGNPAQPTQLRREVELNPDDDNLFALPSEHGGSDSSRCGDET